jgi:undecaprenyl phosphate N,N'-diacetylbacillosamine 1-phosphate transferase
MYPFFKRAIDVAVAGLTLIVLAPLIAVLALSVKLTSRGPVFFKQERLGLKGAPFTMYKFRTMRQGVEMIRNPDGSIFVGDKDPRLTPVGKLLRDYTLDEIPQIINVLKGDMSVVGPRPDLVEHLALYDDLLRRKLEVRPGMASLGLIHGRNSIAWRRRAELDAYYVDHLSLKLDLEIFLKGVVLVLLRRGVYYPEDYKDRI